jgi:protein TonB
VPRRGIAVVAIAVLSGTVAWLGLRDTDPQVPASTPASSAVVPDAGSPPAAVAATTLPTTSVDDLLDAARAAMQERRYTDPADDNAIDRYRAVLQQDPANGEAREGLQRIAAVLQARLESALQERRVDEATRTLGLLHSIRPDAPGLAPLEARLVDLQLRQALADGDLDRARALLARAAREPSVPRAEVARWQAELDRQHGAVEARRLADLVALRIRQGRLAAPAGDSAKHHLAQLRRLPGGSAETVALATTALQQAYLDRLRDALARSQRGDVDRWRAEARALGVGAAEIAAVQREATARAGLAESRQQAAKTAERVRERLGDGRLLEPAGDSALFHLDALRALEPSGGAVKASERELSTKLIDRARAALATGQLDVARTHAAAARQLGVDAGTVAALEREIAASGAVDSSAQPAPPPRLTRTRHLAPDYPKDALKRRVGGQVRLRLTVDASGKVVDAMVVRAEPAGVFDAAATNAARKWRYKPIGPKGSDVTATATVDVAFRPEEASQ